MLAGNPQRGAVFHQADIIDVRDFRTTDTLVYPANNVAEYALCIVVEFGLD